MPNYFKVLMASACLTLALTGPALSTNTSANKATSASNQEAPKPGLQRQNTQTEKDIQDQTAEKRKKITAEALTAVAKTEKALQALDKGKKNSALSALERATGKLELILAREPGLALAPVEVSAVTYDLFNTDVDKVKKVRAEAQDLLDDGRVQDARHLLSDLASETVISVSNIPLATYPEAIKRAAKFIDEGKDDEAKNVLQAALNTLVVTEKIIPLPVADAQAALKEAEKLAEKSARTTAENEQLNRHLAEARSRLKFAQALGYGTQEDFKTLYAQMDEIVDKTSSGKHGRGFFTKIKSSLQELSNSTQPNGNRKLASHPEQNK